MYQFYIPVTDQWYFSSVRRLILLRHGALLRAISVAISPLILLRRTYTAASLCWWNATRLFHDELTWACYLSAMADVWPSSMSIDILVCQKVHKNSVPLMDGVMRQRYFDYIFIIYIFIKGTGRRDFDRGHVGKQIGFHGVSFILRVNGVNINLY